MKIFDEDSLVINAMKNEFYTIVSSGMIIPFIQSQCIANGDNTVSVTGTLDSATVASLTKFAKKYGIKNLNFPNFEIYKALEMNRLLDRSAASSAWAAYNAYKGGSRPMAPTAAPAPSRPADSPSGPAGRPHRRPVADDVPRPAQARPAAPAPDVTRPLEDLL